MNLVVHPVLSIKLSSMVFNHKLMLQQPRRKLLLTDSLLISVEMIEKLMLQYSTTHLAMLKLSHLSFQTL